MALAIEPTVVSDGHGAGLGGANKPHKVGSPVSTTGRLHANAAGKTRLSEWCAVGIAGWCLSGCQLAARLAAGVAASVCWCRCECQLAAMWRPLKVESPTPSALSPQTKKSTLASHRRQERHGRDRARFVEALKRRGGAVDLSSPESGPSHRNTNSPNTRSWSFRDDTPVLIIDFL